MIAPSLDPCMQLVWDETYLLGCGKTACPNLAFPDGQGRTSATLFVCNYAPSNYSGRDPYTTRDDLDDTGCDCPEGLECHRQLCGKHSKLSSQTFFQLLCAYCA